MKTIATVFPASTFAVKKYQFSRRSLIPSGQDYVWKIEAGVVRTLTWLQDRTIVVLGLWGSGDVVGEMLSSANPYQIEALTKVEATITPANEWHPSKEVFLSYVQGPEALMTIRSSRKAEAMLLKLLIWLAQKFGCKVEQGHLIDLQLTHQDLAEFLGLTRVTVTRILSQLERQGLIHRFPCRLVLIKEEFWHYEI